MTHQYRIGIHIFFSVCSRHFIRWLQQSYAAVNYSHHHCTTNVPLRTYVRTRRVCKAGAKGRTYVRTLYQCTLCILLDLCGFVVSSICSCFSSHSVHSILLCVCPYRRTSLALRVSASSHLTACALCCQPA